MDFYVNNTLETHINHEISPKMTQFNLNIREKINTSYVVLEWYQKWGNTNPEIACSGCSSRENKIESIVLGNNETIIMVGTLFYYNPILSGTDVLLIKYDNTGKKLWERIGSLTDNDRPTGVALDANGSIYIIGQTPIHDSYTDDAVLMKFNETGHLLWYRLWGKEGVMEYPYSLVVDNDGSIYVTGLMTPLDKKSLFLLKYDTMGNLLWNRTWELHWGCSVVVDSNNSVCVLGGGGSGGGFILKYNSAGNLLLNRTIGYYPRSVKLDSNDSIYLIRQATHDEDMLIKCDAQGNPIWNCSLGCRGNNILIDDNNTIFIIGNIVLTDYSDIILIKFDGMGNRLWDRIWNVSIRDISIGGTLGRNGTIYVGGRIAPYCTDLALLKYIKDSDWDEMPDNWEVDNMLDPFNPADGLEDPDQDNLLNFKEYAYRTNIYNEDTDEDGIPDGWEVQYFLNPLVYDSNNDEDKDGLTNIYEYIINTNPQKSDTDGDSFSDYKEVLWKTNPLDPLDPRNRIIIYSLVISAFIGDILFTSLKTFQRRPFSFPLKQSQKKEIKHKKVKQREVIIDKKKSFLQIIIEIKDLKEKIQIYQCILCLCFVLGPLFTYIEGSWPISIVILVILFSAIPYWWRALARVKKLQKLGVEQITKEKVSFNADLNDIYQFLAGKTDLKGCPDCKGSGKCSTCSGSGYLGNQLCPICKGTIKCFCKTEQIIEIRKGSQIFQEILAGKLERSHCPYCNSSGICIICRGRGYDKEGKVCPACNGNRQCLCMIYSSLSIEKQREIFNLLNLFEFTMQMGWMKYNS